jgi:glycosyltransferase involved in cell wall biosynthesis
MNFDSNTKLSIVTPLYNEEQACDLFFEKLLPVLQTVTDNFEIVCVDDGSRDGTLDRLLSWRAKDPRIKVVSLRRNFGKDVALMAGLDYSVGDAVIPIDADLQDPPELIPQMVDRWHQGFDTVICVRGERPGDTRRKRWSASLFYNVIGRVSAVDVPPNAGDFRLLDRKLVTALQQLPERSRFMKGLYAWVGSNPSYITYERPRRVAGVSKWRPWRLWNFALDGIFSFTTLPLRIWTYVGLTVSGISVLIGIYITAKTLLFGVEVPGYPTLLLAVLFLSGVNMIGLGILGEYIGRIFLEVKQRPQYLVARAFGYPVTPTDDAALAKEPVSPADEVGPLRERRR